MYCKKCSQFNADDAMYCSNCGAALHDDANANVLTQAYTQGYGAQYNVNEPERVMVIERLKSVFTSKLCLALAILMSISIVASLISPVIMAADQNSLQATIDSIYRYGQTLGIDQQLLQDFVNSLKDSNTRFVLSINIPVVMIIAAVALWMLIYDAKRSAAGQINPRGINTLKTLALVLLIIVCCGVGLFTMLLIPIILTAGLFAGYYSIVIIPFLLLFVSIFALIIVYYAKLYQTLKSASDTVRIGFFVDKISMFVIIIFFIEGAFCFPFLAGSWFAFIRQTLACAINIVAGILLLNYRSTMRGMFGAAAR